MTARVYTVERDYYDQVFRILLTGETELSREGWSEMLQDAYEHVRTPDSRDQAQIVAAAAAYLVGKYGFEYAEEFRG